MMTARPRLWTLAAVLVLACAGVGVVTWNGVRGGAAPLFVRNLGSKAVLGATEKVEIVPWRVTVPARIDTGAAHSSLDARSIEPVGENEVVFTLPEKLGGRRVRRKLVGWHVVKSSDGGSERRPIVTLPIVLGGQRVVSQFTLNDRSHMDYPLLIGRNTLSGRFLVDVTRNPGPAREASAR